MIREYGLQKFQHINYKYKNNKNVLWLRNEYASYEDWLNAVAFEFQQIYYHKSFIEIVNSKYPSNYTNGIKGIVK